MSRNNIKHFDFLTKKEQLISCENARPTEMRAHETAGGSSFHRLTGHGGSDYFLMDSFIEALIRKDKSLILTDVDDSFRSHLVVFAAEQSRKTRQVVDIDEFCASHNIHI